MKDLLE